ncbi:MAG TPA: hypothetical protein VEC19_14185 [Usitatibacter sp.]|nr:hypothetical protein [Usitatibacter sp.]
MKNMTLRLLATLLGLLATALAMAAPFAFVARDNGAVTVIDAETGLVVREIAVGGNPYGLATLPGGARAYVSNLFNNEIAVIDTAAQGVIAQMPIGGPTRGIALSPGGERLFVVTTLVDPTSGASGRFLQVVLTENWNIVASIALPNGADRVVLNPLGTLVFVSNRSGNTVSVIHVASNTLLGNITVAPGPVGLAVDPPGKRLYVAHTPAVDPFTPPVGNTISVVDLETSTVVGTITVGLAPDSLVINPTGTRMFVTNAGSNSVSVVDLGSLGVLATVPVGATPRGIDITPDASQAYVANFGSGTVSVIDANNFNVVRTITVGADPQAIGRFFGGATPVAAQVPGPLSGLWWRPSESGWGIHLTQRRNTVFAAWFTYDAFGAPRWLVSSNCSMSPPCPDCSANAFCTGDLFETTGPRFFIDPYNPGAVTVKNVGVLQIDFRDRDHARMSYVVGGRTRTLDVERQVFATREVPPNPDYTDLWWNPTESGWGIGVTHQGNVMFLTWFVYDQEGKPIWYVASNCEVIPAGNGCRGTLYRTSGPPGPAASDTFDSSRVRANAVGTIEATFSDTNHGVILYTVEGVTASRQIIRQVF